MKDDHIDEQIDDHIDFCPNQYQLMKICGQYNSPTTKAQYCFIELFKDGIERKWNREKFLLVTIICMEEHQMVVTKTMMPLNEEKIEYLRKFLADMQICKW